MYKIGDCRVVTITTGKKKKKKKKYNHFWEETQRKRFISSAGGRERCDFHLLLVFIDEVAHWKS